MISWYITDLIVPSTSVIQRRNVPLQSYRWLYPDIALSLRSTHSAYAVAIPSIWNSLPQDTRNALTFTEFHKRLTWHLFDVAYLHLGGYRNFHIVLHWYYRCHINVKFTLIYWNFHLTLAINCAVKRVISFLPPLNWAEVSNPIPSESKFSNNCLIFFSFLDIHLSSRSMNIWYGSPDCFSIVIALSNTNCKNWQNNHCLYLYIWERLFLSLSVVAIVLLVRWTVMQKLLKYVNIEIKYRIHVSELYTHKSSTKWDNWKR